MIKNKVEKVLYTVGHSTHSLEELTAILNAYEIKKLIDIRSIPKSRHNPQFNKDNLKEKLKRRYMHMAGLGGLRNTRKDSPNTGWKNDSFRGFADYMLTEEFEKALNELIKRVEKQKVAIMCGEAVPWRCHRSLIGDAMVVRGFDVIDIYSASTSKPHKLTGFAKVKGTRLTYPSENQAGR